MSVMAPCLAKSLTQAPSRPTTSGRVFEAAPVISCCLVEAYGALSSLILMFGFCAVKSLTILSRSPAGSSAPHHSANSSVTAPPEAEPPESLEPHAATKATVATAVTAPITRFSRVARTAMMAPSISRSSCSLQRWRHVSSVLQMKTREEQQKAANYGILLLRVLRGLASPGRTSLLILAALRSSPQREPQWTRV